MARKTTTYTVSDEGRDQNKSFLITEMPASKAEAWATRALLALIKGGVELPDGFESMGMAGLVQIGIQALSGLGYETAEPLLAQMFDCIEVVPDPTKPHVRRTLIEQDIEEVSTRIKLRAEVWKLHTDFLMAVAPSISAQTPAAKGKATPNI